MNAVILNKVAKENKVILRNYMKVSSFINESYTKVIITFFDEEGVGFHRTRCNQKTIIKSVNAILKREEFPEDYETNGAEWIIDIR